MDKKYYEIEEVRALFDSYLRGPFPEMKTGEYEIFCSALKILPIDIVDRVQKDICFVNLRDDNPENIVCATCNINLGHTALKDKKGIILLTPYVIGDPDPPAYIKKDGTKDILINGDYQGIAHEIAHRILGHTGYEDETDREVKEKAANELVAHWMQEYFDFNSLPD
jgi:hypothetical protein